MTGCSCDRMGSVNDLCQPEQGTCECLPNVAGPNCSVCEPNFWGLTDRAGCRPCSCDEIGNYLNKDDVILYSITFSAPSLGSTSLQCDDIRGDCMCRPGITGTQCNMCEDGYFGFSGSGCRLVALSAITDCFPTCSY